MAKTTHHAVEVEGFRFTRSSKTRVYSHAVLLRRSRSAERLQDEANTRSVWRSNLAYHQELAAGIFKLAEKYPEQYTPARRAAEQAKAQAYLAPGEDGQVAASLARFDAYSAELKMCADGDSYLVCIGWSSRLVLAENLARSQGGFTVPAVIDGGAR